MVREPSEQTSSYSSLPWAMGSPGNMALQDSWRSEGWPVGADVLNTSASVVSAQSPIVHLPMEWSSGLEKFPCGFYPVFQRNGRDSLPKLTRNGGTRASPLTSRVKLVTASALPDKCRPGKLTECPGGVQCHRKRKPLHEPVDFTQGRGNRDSF